MKALHLVGNVTSTSDASEGIAFYACVPADTAKRLLKAAEAVKELEARKIFIDCPFWIHSRRWLSDGGEVFMSTTDTTDWPQSDMDEWGDSGVPDDDDAIRCGADYAVTDGDRFWFQTTGDYGEVYLTDSCDLAVLKALLAALET